MLPADGAPEYLQKFPSFLKPEIFYFFFFTRTGIFYMHFFIEICTGLSRCCQKNECLDACKSPEAPVVQGCRTLLSRLVERVGQEHGGGWCGATLVITAMPWLLHPLQPVLRTAFGKCSFSHGIICKIKVAAIVLTSVIFLQDPKNNSAYFSVSL